MVRKVLWAWMLAVRALHIIQGTEAVPKLFELELLCCSVLLQYEYKVYMKHGRHHSVVW